MSPDWRRVATWFGVLALVDAVVLVLPLPVVPAPVAGAVPPAVVPVVALVAAGLGVKLLVTAGGSAPDRTPARRPDAGTGNAEAAARGDDLVGASTDEALAVLTGETGEHRWNRRAAADALQRELREAAVGALVAAGHGREEAERLVDAGAWTDDERAAAFLGERPLPLWLRVYDWATGGARADRARAAAREVAGLVAEDAPAGRDDGDRRARTTGSRDRTTERLERALEAEP